MAFIAFENCPAFLPPLAAPHADRLAVQDVAEPSAARFSALEWLVVALARKDRPASLKGPWRLASTLCGVFGRANPKLADTRLEALRRMAVLSWHRGYAVPASEVEAFLGAGFSIGQYETMLSSIAVAREQNGAR